VAAAGVVVHRILPGEVHPCLVVLSVLLLEGQANGGGGGLKDSSVCSCVCVCVCEAGVGVTAAGHNGCVMHNLSVHVDPCLVVLDVSMYLKGQRPGGGGEG
jgi:hypothetical protein